MPKKIKSPSQIEAAGNKSKIIEEYIGCKNTETDQISIARMKSPPGWEEPGQRPEFDEFSVVLKGVLQVESEKGILEIHPGEAVIVHKGEWVQYSTPGKEETEYISVCLPAFSPERVHRDKQ
jgi:mannose-6-phosphate isomerase-like protein (cupin superfamily)